MASLTIFSFSLLLSLIVFSLSPRTRLWCECLPSSRGRYDQEQGAEDLCGDPLLDGPRGHGAGRWSAMGVSVVELHRVTHRVMHSDSSTTLWRLPPPPRRFAATTSKQTSGVSASPPSSWPPALRPTTNTHP